MEIIYEEDVKHLDLTKKPKKQSWWTLLIIWTISFVVLRYYHHKINKVNTKKIKPPYLLLCNHMQFLDFMVSAMANFPYRINNIVSVDGFNLWYWLLRKVGSIPKRKFTNDISLVRHINYVLTQKKNIVGLYPEARYSFSGATSVLPDSLAKMIKLLKTPVVVLTFKGHHLQHPAWAQKSRKVKTTSVMKQILSKEDIENLSFEEIDKIIKENFAYNDYEYQKTNEILIKEKYRSEGLEKILYKCPHCGTEFEMESEGATIVCNHCQKAWWLCENGELDCLNGETLFKTIPEWYDWERKEVRKEIENGDYQFMFTAPVVSLPHPRRFIELGEATFAQDMHGIRIKGYFNGKEYTVQRTPLENYSLHVEYRFPYLNKKDIVSVSTKDDTLFFMPKDSRKIQKLSLATEELYEFTKGSLNSR